MSPSHESFTQEKDEIEEIKSPLDVCLVLILTYITNL